MSTTILTDDQIIRILEENRSEYDGLDKAIAVSRAIEQAVLQSPEIQALREALEVMVEMIEMNGFGFHYAMDLARAALGQKQGD